VFGFSVGFAEGFGEFGTVVVSHLRHPCLVTCVEVDSKVVLKNVLENVSASDVRKTGTVSVIEIVSGGGGFMDTHGAVCVGNSGGAPLKLVV